PESDQGEARRLQEDAARHHESYLLWNSGEPRMRPATRAASRPAPDCDSTVLRVDSDRPSGTSRAASASASIPPSPAGGARAVGVTVTPRTRPAARSSAKLRRASSPLVETQASAVSL